MPFVSQQQRRWMYANEPEMAKRWEKETPKGKKLPNRVGKEQQGGLYNTNPVGYIDSTLNANRNLNFVKRLYEKNTPSIQLPNQPYPSTHLMESGDGLVYPRVVMKDGRLQNLGDEAWKYARQTGEQIKFPNDQMAQWFGKNYKKGTGVLSKQKDGGYSTQGYKSNSPDKNNPYNIIPSGDITMQGVNHPILGIDNTGFQQLMMPGQDYKFKGNKVLEIPIKQSGGKTKEKLYVAPEPLPEVNVYTTPNKVVRSFLNQMAGKKNIESFENISTPNSIRQKPWLADKDNVLVKQEWRNQVVKDFEGRDFDSDKYHNAWKSWMENGKPNINYQERNNYTDYGRASFYSRSNQLNVPIDAGNWNISSRGSVMIGDAEDSYIAELSHSNQLKNYGYSKYQQRASLLHEKYPSASEYDTNAYNDPLSIEGEAHSVIEPKLKKKYNMGFQMGGYQTINQNPLDRDLNNIKPPVLNNLQPLQFQPQQRHTKEPDNLSFLPMFTNSIAQALATRVSNKREEQYQMNNLSNPLNYIPNTNNTNDYVNYGTPSYQEGGSVEDGSDDNDYEDFQDDDFIMQGAEEAMPQDTVTPEVSEITPEPEQQDEIIELPDEDYQTPEIGNSEEELIPNYTPIDIGNNLNKVLGRMNPAGSPNKREQEATNYLVQKGVPDHIAAGIVGNLIQESGLNPHAVQQGGNGRGIAQWDVRDRFQGLKQFAAQTGRPHNDLYTQLDYLLEEARGRGDLSKIETAKSPTEAAYLFAKHFERPRRIEDIRMKNAERIFKNRS